MDLFNKAMGQLADQFRSMSAAGRMTAGLLLLVIVIGAAYLFNHSSTTEGYLFGGEAVSSSQLPTIEAAFGKKNLTDYQVQGNRIRVPQGKQSVYMAALADAGAMPQNFLDSMKTSLNSGGWLVDRKKHDELVKVALQEELSKIIGQMNGIERATVLYNVETPQGWNAKKQITASVTVKPVGKKTLDSEQLQMIRQAVGPAIGAAPESVAIVDINGRAYAGGETESTADLSQNRYLRAKHQYEKEYTDSIRQALDGSFVKGAVIAVNVELHPEFEDIQTTAQNTAQPTSTDSPETNKSSSNKVLLPSGVQNAPAGAPNSPLTVSESSNALRNSTETTAQVDRTAASPPTRQVRSAPLTPKRVSVSVGVPSSYYEQVWHQRNGAAPIAWNAKPNLAAMTQLETETNANIKKIVMGIVPTTDASAGDSVTVASFAAVSLTPIEKPNVADLALGWAIDHATAVGIALLAIICLLIIRSMTRAGATNGYDQRYETTTSRTDTEEMIDIQPAQPTPARPRRRPLAGVSPRDELVEIVRDDPDGAAEVLRNWIGAAN